VLPISQVPPEVRCDAIGLFDRELRDRSDWAGWEKNGAHLYAIEHNTTLSSKTDREYGDRNIRRLIGTDVPHQSALYRRGPLTANCPIAAAQGEPLGGLQQALGAAFGSIFE
jgi:hypothetical protein